MTTVEEEEQETQAAQLHLADYRLTYPLETADTAAAMREAELPNTRPIQIVNKDNERMQFNRQDLRRIMGDMLNDVCVNEYLTLMCSTNLQYNAEHLPANFAPYIYEEVPIPIDDPNLSKADLHHRLRNFDLFTCDVLISPIITGGHITAVIADRRCQEIVHYDSMGDGNRTYALELGNWLQEHWEWRVTHGGPEQGQYPQQGQWTCRGASRVDTPQQQDGISCGVFAITFATLILMQIPLRHFSQNLVPRMRLHVANCILSQACPLPACVNEMGNRLGTYIVAGDTQRLFRPRIRRGVREDPDTVRARGMELQRRGRYIEIDLDNDMATTSTTASEIRHDEVTTGATTRERRYQQRQCNTGGTGFEDWITRIKGTECPTELLAKEHITSRSKGLLRRMIEAFRNNTKLQVLRIQGLGIDDELLQLLVEVLSTTVVYGVNLGEGLYGREALRTFAEKLEYTYVVQVYFENVTTDIKHMILTACERNRRKLPTLLSLYRIIVPEHIWMMWPRLKTGEEEKPLPQLKKRKMTKATETGTNKRHKTSAETELSDIMETQMLVHSNEQKDREDSSRHSNTETWDVQGATLRSSVTHATHTLYHRGSGFVGNESSIEVTTSNRTGNVDPPVQARRTPEETKRNSQNRQEERKSFRTGITPLPRFRVGETAARRRQLLTDRLHATSRMDTNDVPGHQKEEDPSFNIHDANQALKDSELDFVLIESFTDKVDGNNQAVELSSPRPLHHAAVREQTRHSEELDNYTDNNAREVATSEHTDRLEAARQDTGAGRAKRKRTDLPEATLAEDRSIGSMDEEELLKRRRLAGEGEGSSSAGLDEKDASDISDGMCNFSQYTARP